MNLSFIKSYSMDKMDKFVTFWVCVEFDNARFSNDWILDGVLHKKSKTDNIQDLPSMIGKVGQIIEKLRHDITSGSDMATEINRRRVFKRPVFGHEWLNVTNSDGDRVFLRIAPDSDNTLQEEVNL